MWDDFHVLHLGMSAYLLSSVLGMFVFWVLRWSSVVGVEVDSYYGGPRPDAKLSCSYVLRCAVPAETFPGIAKEGGGYQTFGSCEETCLGPVSLVRHKVWSDILSTGSPMSHSIIVGLTPVLRSSHMLAEIACGVCLRDSDGCALRTFLNPRRDSCSTGHRPRQERLFTRYPPSHGQSTGEHLFTVSSPDSHLLYLASTQTINTVFVATTRAFR